MMEDRDVPYVINAPKTRAFFGGVSDMWISRRLSDDPHFPKPILIASRRYWRLSDLREYAEAKASA
jgi:predicted DNA-binding transcriptional regulator AlpA